jgi:hypothetical protein
VAKASRIVLSAGRELRLQELSQRLTYEGLLEGLPTTEANRAQLDRLVAEQRAKKRSMNPVYLVAPVETPIDLGPGTTYPFGSPATLPEVICIGRLQSEPIGERDPSLYSELTIIWFQSEFAMPIEPSVLEQIGKLDWDALASNFEY